MRHYGKIQNLSLVVAVSTIAACGGSSRPAAPQALAVIPAQATKTSAQAGELLKRTGFPEPRSVPWMPFFNAPASGDGYVKQGAYCLRIDKPGKNLWDVQFRHREMTIVKDHEYTVRFTAWSSSPVGIRSKVGMSGPPYTEYWGSDFDITEKPAAFSDTFTAFAPDDPSAEFSFLLNDERGKLPVEICFNDLHLTDPAFVPEKVSTANTAPPIRVNQLGYFPNEPKRATWVLSGIDAEERAKKVVTFEVIDGTGAVHYRGTSEPFGRDATSNAYVQRLDFSSVTTARKDLKLRITESEGAPVVTSDSFAIDAELLKPISRDALRYFYHTRSGIALKQPYVENAQWERVEGHPTDKQVPCAPDANCSYSFDVSGGWYDAGDYGKYVVNGGYSVWMLMNLWELAQQNGLTIVGAKDRDLNIPESGNGLPDLLDEAKWELEWLLKMQVPEGIPQAGLVHHKMHDDDWSALGTLPLISEKTPRHLRPVSTAATLNLAASAAQASRLFAKLDPSFAARCKAAAIRAWDAAEKNPALLITGSDHNGGGAYEDQDVSDERFWAAAELFLTTRDARYENAVKKSAHFLRPQAQTSGADTYQAMDWQSTEALGTIALALDPKSLSADARERSKKSIVDVAERFLALSKADGFGQPYAGTHYTWGSNSFLLNNGIILAYAHAFTGERRFLEGAISTMDYILGRNALGKSYVTGYGSRPLVNPHHRMWAHSIAPKFPPPPPGVVSGGPNSDLQDPYSKSANLGCVGQTCFVDHIDAYSANEVAINWNAELAWLTAYLNAAVSKTL